MVKLTQSQNNIQLTIYQIQVTIYQVTGENAANLCQNLSSIGHKESHENLSSRSTRHKTKFFGRQPLLALLIFLFSLSLSLSVLSGPVLRDTARLSQRYPPIARYGVFGVSTWPIGCDTPSPFSEHFPFESMQSGGAIPPLKRGFSAIPARYRMKTRQMGAIPPSAILSRKGIAR